MFAFVCLCFGKSLLLGLISFSLKEHGGKSIVMHALETSIQKNRSSASPVYDVVIVGAGPYGLSLAAHLARLPLRLAIFGKPFGFWRDCVPPEIALRSHWSASTLSDPEKLYSLSRYFETSGVPSEGPFYQSVFVDYGLWFQKHVVPAVDETYVKQVTRDGDGFAITLEDGRLVYSARVVIATGLGFYAYVPPEYQHLTPKYFSHTSEHPNFQRFQNQRVAVIGGGQSAMETTALLVKEGADFPHLISRHSIHWLTFSAKNAVGLPDTRPLWQRIRYPYARLSPGLFNHWAEQHPYMFHRLPRPLKERLMRGPGAFRAGASHALRQSVEEKAAIHEVCHVLQIQEEADHVHLALSDGSQIDVDHIILGTGYRVDLQRLPILPPELRESIRTYQQNPVLTHNYESSVPGLYFIGFASMDSFGPIYRFVIGAEATSLRLTRVFARTRAKVRAR